MYGTAKKCIIDKKHMKRTSNGRLITEYAGRNLFLSITAEFCENTLTALHLRWFRVESVLFVVVFISSPTTIDIIQARNSTNDFMGILRRPISCCFIINHS